LIPALSGPPAEDVAAFAAANLSSFGADANALVLSLRDDPKRSASRMLWHCVSSKRQRFANVAIVAVGSLDLGEKGRRIVARIANYSDAAVQGVAQLRSPSQIAEDEPRPLQERALIIQPEQEAVVTFEPKPEWNLDLTIEWRGPNHGYRHDALPEDDIVALAYRASRRPRIRFHGAQPALRALFESALKAEIVDEKGDSKLDIDLDVYTRALPERLPDDSRAALFLEPSRGFQSFFDIGEKTLQNPQVVRGADDALNANMTSVPGEIQISKAQEFLETGDFKTILRDATSGRALALRFFDERARPCFALAFSPGGDAAAIQPTIAALLLRMAKEATHAGAPYAVTRAAELELASRQPMPLEVGDRSVSVLDETASRLTTGAGSGDLPARPSTPARAVGTTQTLAAWFAALALLVALLESARGMFRR
jgi:hypothetical protein